MFSYAPLITNKVRSFIAVFSIAFSLFLASPIPLANAQGIPAPYMEQQVQAQRQTSGTDGQSGFTKTLTEVVMSMLQLVQSLFAMLVYAGGLALNASAYYSIVKLGQFMNTSPGLAVAWGTFRDLGNIVIIFGFIAVGITIILDIASYNAKKMLATLLIVAVLMNFSSLIARGIIDAGNVVALQFYKAVNGGDMPSDSFIDTGISGRLIEATKLTTIYDSSTLPDSVKESPATGMLFITFASIILYTITAFVFFAIAILFIARMVILMFLITISPLAFAAMTLPRFRSEASRWWSLLIDNTLVAPLLMLLLWVSTKVVTDGTLIANLGGPGGDWKDIGTPMWANVLVMFGVVCGFFLASLLIAKKLSAFGASFATSAGAQIVFGGSAKLAGIGLGGGSRLVRYGIQHSGLAEKKWARPVAGALRFTEGLNIDARRAPLVSKGLAAVGAGKGAVAGKSSWNDMGLVDALNVKKKYENAVASSNKQWDAEMREINEDRQTESLTNAAADTTPGSVLSPDNLKHLSSLSAAELSELKEIKEGNKKLVENLSPEQFENLMKSDKLTEVEKNNIKKERYAPLRTALASGVPANIKKALNSMSKGEREQMPADIISNPAVLKNLSDKQRDEMRDSKHRTSAERKAIAALDPVSRISAIYERHPDQAANLLNSVLTPKQVAKLPTKTLTDSKIIEKFIPATLKAIQDEGKLKAGEISAISSAIRASGRADLIAYISSGPGAAYW